jgi:hypothetical protein
MPRQIVAFLTLLVAFVYGPAGSAGELGLSLRPAVPEGLGCNIHFTDAKPGEMQMLADGGFTWVRMDFSWGGTERTKGEYDFSAFDRLLDSLDERKIRALLILDYHNRFYDEGLSPYSDEGRQAMARWAAAAVTRYKGRGVLWEMYNEPNIHFWKPKPNPPDYVKLALEVGKAIRAVAPNEAYIGPATSEIDLEFLETCFKGGLLDYWDAVSVHPYRQKPPETVAPEYAKLRRLIAQYAPKGKTIPILSAEWGYSAAWKSFDSHRQGKYLPRQWLVNLSQDVPLSIWYDWHDDGRDPKEAEHNFGTVRHEYFKDRTPVYEPKPAYLAAQALTRSLNGYTYSKRLAVESDDDYCLLFAKGTDVRLAVWTVDDEREVTIPASPGTFQVVGHTGEKRPSLRADGKGLKVRLTDSVQYLAPEQPNELLQVAAAWERAPLEIIPTGSDRVLMSAALRNPLGRTIQVGGKPLPSGQTVHMTQEFLAPRSDTPVRTVWQLEVEGVAFTQTLNLVSTNPLRLRFIGLVGNRLLWCLENPSADGYRGVLSLVGADDLAVDSNLPVDMPVGETRRLVALTLKTAPAGGFRLGWTLGRENVCDLRGEPASYSRADDFGRLDAPSLAADYRLQPDGDAKVASTQAISIAQPPDGPLATGIGALKIDYTFEAGWKFLHLRPKAKRLEEISGRPKALALWVYGDESGNRVRMRVVDSTGQCFQPDGGPIDWKGWRQVVMPLDRNAGHWGGADDGTIHWPIKLDTLFLLDSAHRKASTGSIFIAAPMWIE